MSKTNLGKLLPFSVLLLLVLPAIAPLLSNRFMITIDGATHLLRLGALQRAVMSGLLNPYWISEMQLGHGYPLFIFYPIGGYYLALLPALAGFPINASYNLGLALVVLCAGAGAWLLARDVHKGNPSAALVAGLAYSYAPYLIFNVYVRSALPEALGQALLPWLLWSGRRVVGRTSPGIWGYMVVLIGTLAGLMLTHSLLLMLALPYLLIYWAIMWWHDGHSLPTLIRLCLSLAAAAGASAWFWLPMLTNRQYLTDLGYQAARLGWLPDNVWTWTNFLDPHLVYEYAPVYPLQLGLVQVGLALGGFALARRRDAEWLFFGVSALVCSLLVGSWALPFWLSSDVLTAVQFPWRLLSLVALSCAMLTPGWLHRLPAARWQWPAAGLLVALMLLTQRPPTGESYPACSIAFASPMLAAHEVAKGVLTTDSASSVTEFRPRWSTAEHLPAEPVHTAARPSNDQFRLQVLQAGPAALTMQVQAAVTTTLRFQDYYFPGWEVIGPQGVALAPYPSGQLGLLTVDLPPGDYKLEKRFTAPPWAAVGTAISFLTLALLLLYLLYRHTWWMLAPTLVLTLCVAGYAYKPENIVLQQPSTPLKGFGLELAAFDASRVESGQIEAKLYWQIRKSPPADLRLRVQVRSPSGQIVQEYLQRPYFNQISKLDWSPDMLVEDALQVALPDGVGGGRYILALGLERETDNPMGVAASMQTVVIGEVDAPHSSGMKTTALPTIEARWDNVASLLQANITAAGDARQSDDGRPLMVKPGDEIRVRLYWLPSAAQTQELHGFVHLVDAQEHVVAQRDQTPGPDFQPSTLWLPGVEVADEYRLQIPVDATSAVVWPHVGLYDAATNARLTLAQKKGAESSTAPSDYVELAPIKIVSGRERSQAASLPQRLDVYFGETVELTAAQVEVAADDIHAGDNLTITLGLHSLAPTNANLIRFIHLLDPEQNIAAQTDGAPQMGLNPTWSWAPDETILDQVVLTMPDTAEPGPYQVIIGFYDQANTNKRIAATDAQGNRLPDDQALLGEIQVVPSKILHTTDNGSFPVK